MKIKTQRVTRFTEYFSTTWRVGDRIKELKEEGYLVSAEVFDSGRVYGNGSDLITVHFKIVKR